MRFGGESQQELGWIVENAVLQCAVDQRVSEMAEREHSNLCTFIGDSVQRVAFPHMQAATAHALSPRASPELSRPRPAHFVTGGEKPLVSLESGAELSANLVVCRPSLFPHSIFLTVFFRRWQLTEPIHWCGSRLESVPGGGIISSAPLWQPFAQVPTIAPPSSGFCHRARWLCCHCKQACPPLCGLHPPHKRSTCVRCQRTNSCTS